MAAALAFAMLCGCGGQAKKSDAFEAVSKGLAVVIGNLYCAVVVSFHVEKHLFDFIRREEFFVFVAAREAAKAKEHRSY